MTQYQDLSTHDGNFKNKYGKKYEDLLPNFAIFQDDIAFANSEKVGKQYVQALKVSRCHSYTRKAATDPLGVLRPVSSSKIVSATLNPSIINGRNGIQYTAIFRGTGGDTSFTPEMDVMVDDLWEGGHHQLESDIIYGGQSKGIAVVESVSGNNVVLTEASYGGGTFTGVVGEELDGFPASLATQRTGAGSDAYGTKFYTVTAMNNDSRTITFDDATNIVAGDVLAWRGSIVAGGTPVYKSMVGLHEIIFGTGTLFGVDRATYELWNANQVDAGGGEFSFDQCLEGSGKALIKGQMGNFKTYVTPQAWNNAMSDLAALRRIQLEDQVRKVVLGAENIEFYLSTGKNEVVGHPMIKNANAYGIPAGQAIRVGSTDFTFANPAGVSNFTKSIFFDRVPNSDGFEIGSFSDQAIWPGKVGRYFGIHSIVNA